MNMKQSINPTSLFMAPSLGFGRKKNQKRIMKWKNSHVFLLKKVGGAVFRGAVFR